MVNNRSPRRLTQNSDMQRGAAPTPQLPADCVFHIGTPQVRRQVRAVAAKPARSPESTLKERDLFAARMLIECREARDDIRLLSPVLSASGKRRHGTGASGVIRNFVAPCAADVKWPGQGVYAVNGVQIEVTPENFIRMHIGGNVALLPTRHIAALAALVHYRNQVVPREFLEKIALHHDDRLSSLDAVLVSLNEHLVHLGMLVYRSHPSGYCLITDHTPAHMPG